MTAPNLLEAVIEQLVELYGAERVAGILGDHLDAEARMRVLIGWEVLGAIRAEPTLEVPAGWRVTVAQLHEPGSAT